METRANYVLIGAFTLAVIAAAFGFPPTESVDYHSFEPDLAKTVPGSLIVLYPMTARARLP